MAEFKTNLKHFQSKKTGTKIDKIERVQIIRRGFMKKMLLTAILIMSQLSFAAATSRMNVSQARARVEASKTYTDIVKAREKGMDLTDTTNRQSAELAEKVMRVVKDNLKGIVEVKETDAASILKLLNINAKEVLTEVARLSSIARDANVTEKEKKMAEKSLELIVLASHTINSMVMTSGRDAEQVRTDAQKQSEAVAKMVEISRKISELDFGQASKTFVEKYEKALMEGKSVDEAIRLASNGKFTEKELRECE